MSDHLHLSPSTIQGWLSVARAGDVSASAGKTVPREAGSVRRALLGEATLEGMDENEALAFVSALSNELIASRSPSEEILTLAQFVCRWLSTKDRSADCFGETSELLSRFDFIAWRHSRWLEGASPSQEWAERYDQDLLRGSTHLECLQGLLFSSEMHQGDQVVHDLASDPETLYAICAIFREERNSWPERIGRSALALFDYLHSNPSFCDFGDERFFFLTQLATTIGVCSRWIGEMERSAAWINAAERFNRQTIAPELGECEVAFNRLIAFQEEGRWAETVDALKDLQPRLQSFGMLACLAKSEILLSDCLKLLGLVHESVEPLRRALKSPALEGRPVLRAYALLFLADSYAILGRSAESDSCLRFATSILHRHQVPTAVAHLSLVAGGRFREAGQLDRALNAFVAARITHEELGLNALAAYARLLAAEVLLALGREGEARSEILLALPVIEGAGLLAKQAAALALLRESIRREHIDGKSIRDVAAQLKGFPK